MLQVRLLGQFDVRLDDRPIEISSHPAQTLLAYLLLYRDRQHPRARVAGLLWGDSDESAARNNLKQALWQLRQSIGSPYVMSDKFTLAFNTDLSHWFDVAVLTQNSREPTVDVLKTQLAVYGGDLLPGFYDDWVALERTRLAATFEAQVQTLLDCLIQASSWREAIEWAERWIALGNIPEPAFRALMKCYAGLGNMAGLVSAYRRCIEALDTNLGVPPSPQTRDLYGALINHPADVLTAPRPEPGPVAVEAEPNLVRMWIAAGRASLDLTQLSIVHACESPLKLDDEELRLVIRSALDHHLNLVPWLRHASHPEGALRVLDGLWQEHPRPTDRLRLLEALAEVDHPDKEARLLDVVRDDDSHRVRSQAALTLSQQGQHRVVMRTLAPLLKGTGNSPALTAFTAVADAFGIPPGIPTYPRVPVAFSLAALRWQNHRAAILRQSGGAALGATLLMVIQGVLTPVYMLPFPELFQKNLLLVGLTGWIIVSILGMVFVGAGQGLLTGLLVGLADAWLRPPRRLQRMMFGAAAGLYHSLYLIVGSETGMLGPLGVYLGMVYIFYGLMLGALLSLVVPRLGTYRSRKAQLLRGVIVGLAAMLVTVPVVWLAYLKFWEGVLPRMMGLAFLLVLGVALGTSDKRYAE